MITLINCTGNIIKFFNRIDTYTDKNTYKTILKPEAKPCLRLEPYCNTHIQHIGYSYKEIELDQLYNKKRPKILGYTRQYNPEILELPEPKEGFSFIINPDVLYCNNPILDKRDDLVLLHGKVYEANDLHNHIGYLGIIPDKYFNNKIKF